MPPRKRSTSSERPTNSRTIWGDLRGEVGPEFDQPLEEFEEFGAPKRPTKRIWGLRELIRKLNAVAARRKRR